MRLLLVSDACCPTGFARVNENLLRHLAERWEIAMLGINATGDPYEWPCSVYPAMLGGDPFGYGRFLRILKREDPDVVLIHSDPWIVAKFVNIACGALEDGGLDYCPPLVAYMPVDAPAMRRACAKALNKIALALFYTQFGLSEARAAGFTGIAAVIPLGVDTELYQPRDRNDSRRRIFPGIDPEEAFIVGNINRNQPRKRLDLSIAYFAKWVTEYRHEEAYLYLHCAPTDPLGWNIGHLTNYYGLRGRIFIPPISAREGIAEIRMAERYSALDLQMSTTLGEGWGLTQVEGMACGVPQVVPEWSALAEWPRGAVRYVPVTSTLAHIGHDSNCIGGVPDELAFIEALEELYASPILRQELGRLGYERARSPEFEWRRIAAQFDAALSSVIGMSTMQAA